jgi:hypothetical protein
MKIVKNYFITLAKSTLVIVLTAVTFASCSKDKSDDTPTPVISTPIGYWTGKYGAGSTLGLNYAVLLKADGSMRSYVMSGDKTDTATASSKGAGNWQQMGNSIKTEYTAGGYNFKTTATANEAFTNMTGTWQAVGSVFAGGFTLTKQ